MPEFFRPSRDEIVHFYDGLPSKPLLVARTCTTPFPPVPPELTPAERNERAYPYVRAWGPGMREKSFQPIGNANAADSQEPHKIVRVWCTALRDELVAVLDRSPLAACWSTLYTVRVSTAWRYVPARVKPTSEVVLLVGINVAVDDPAFRVPRWEEALQAALACRDVLLAWGVQDVHVQVLTSSVVGLGGGGGGLDASSDDQSSTSGSEHTTSTTLDALVDLDFESAPSLVKHTASQHRLFGDSIHSFLDFPGQRLERSVPTDKGNRPSGLWGSLGLHVSLGGGQDGYALTTRHVAVGERLPCDKRVTQDDQIPVLWGTQDSLCKYARSLKKVARGVQSVIQGQTRAYKKHQETMAKDSGDVSAEDREKLAKKMEKIEKDMSELEADMAKRTTYANDYLPRLIHALEALASGTGDTDDIPPQRLLGYVANAAPHGRTRHGAWSDWALVRLSDERRHIVQSHEVINSVRLDSWPDYSNALHEIVPCPFASLAYANKFLPMEAPSAADADNTAGRGPWATQHPRWVVKRGPKTGLTYGLTVEIEAVVRRPRADGTLVAAYALLILDHRCGKAAFGGSGDSGSAVLDIDGRILGMVDAGARSGVGPGDMERLVRLFCREEDPGELASDPAVVVTRPLPFDVTLATPLEWVLDNIEEVTGMRPVVL